jgi:hypothetical protein
VALEVDFEEVDRLRVWASVAGEISKAVNRTSIVRFKISLLVSSLMLTK